MHIFLFAFPSFFVNNSFNPKGHTTKTLSNERKSLLKNTFI